MPRTRKIYWLWLGVGLAILAQNLIANDGGILGLLSYWELRLFGLVFLTPTVFLLLALIGIPAAGLWNGRAKKRQPTLDRETRLALYAKRTLIMGILFGAAAALAYAPTTVLPSPDGPVQRLSLDGLPAGATVSQQRCVIAGALQRQYRIYYQEVLTGRMTSSSFSHNFIPITASAWTPSQPVRFLVDAPSGFRATGQSGLLLRGHIPSYVRRALQQKGLHIESDAMVFSSDPDFGRTGWYAAAALFAIGAFASLVIAFAARLVGKATASQMEILVPRLPAYFLFMIGIIPIAFAIALGAPKAFHMASAAKTDGIVESVEVSGDDLFKYSFYVDYTTPQGRFHRDAKTDTPFSKAVGDRVTVLYQPDDPRRAEIVAFDSDWFVCTLLFAVGAIFLLAGAILLRRTKTHAAGAGLQRTAT